MKGRFQIYINTGLSHQNNIFYMSRTNGINSNSGKVPFVLIIEIEV